MIDGWVVITAALAYLVFLFLVASLGDRQARRGSFARGRPTIYALSLAVYCTSWTFFGSVGLSATTGFDFIPVYLGASLMIAAGWPLIRRIVRLSKMQNITSIADFIAARYGKSQFLAAIVAAIAVVGMLPYIALQLKAVSQSVTTLLGPTTVEAVGQSAPAGTPLGDVPFLIALTMAAFAILFGTRHIDATEHQHGLMLAIATESVVKVVAFLTVGIFVTFFMFGGVEPLLERAANNEAISALFSRGFNGGVWLTITFLSLVCILLLPRQFHVTVVENNSEREIKRAAWLFPLYLIVINLFVVPIAMAGLVKFPDGSVDADMFVLALPMAADAPIITMVAFIGGLSAATAMVIVASVALSIMICNDLVVPLLLRRRAVAVADREDLSAILLNIRRAAIFGIMLLAYIFYRMVGDNFPLASIGLLSFSAIAQFAPAFFGGLIWRRATARGAIAGIVAGFSVWAYTLLLPSFVSSGWITGDILENGPFDIALLRPQMLFNLEFDPLTHGVLWSLFANILSYIVLSLLRPAEPIERLQANMFTTDNVPKAPAPAFRLWRTSISVEELQGTAARYVGEERARRSFAEYSARQSEPLRPLGEADLNLLRFAEYLIASAVGAASSRLVMSLMLKRGSVSKTSALKLLDDASEAIQYNRDLLQSALDQVRQGIAVFDRDMRLICWNRQFRKVLELPMELGRIGVPLNDLVRYAAERGDYGDGSVEDLVADRLHKYVVTRETFHERLHSGRKVLEIGTSSMPDGGIVSTFTDITEQVEAADTLARVNETLERRVRERTAELTAVNHELTFAKAKADEANYDKTRFLAAASHDILQPLNAARLYTTSLVERKRRGEEGRLARSVDASLEAVEEILGTLLDISRLDTGAMKPELSVFPINDVLQQLKLEFEPLANGKGLDLRVVSCSLYARSDRRLLRRAIQNLVSNALKFTQSGHVLLGCRRHGDALSVEVYDTGPGIPRDKHQAIFKEFQRLHRTSGGTRGLGLGLSIVERIGRVLDHPLSLRSEVGRGSMFSLTIPVASPAAAAKSSRKRGGRLRRGFAGDVILCLDNEPDILEGMESLLTNWGCRVLKAQSSEDAIRLVRKGTPLPDIILADYHLDQGTGLDAVWGIWRAMGSEAPAIIITADSSPEVEERVKGAGLQILRKPVKPAALRALLSSVGVRREAAE